MAKAKKAVAITLEERLEQALVPEAEQPYTVPENWCWVYAPAIFMIEYGKGLSTKDLTDSGYPVFGANGQIGFYSSYMFERPQALMSCRGAYSGSMNISLEKSFVTSNSLVISSKKNSIEPKYICCLLDSLEKDTLISGSAQPQVTVQAFANYPIPLIPLAEQQRIVDRIESLFAKLDEAKEKAQAALDSFEIRKAAILHKAFTGELTAKWREENPNIKNDTIGDISLFAEKLPTKYALQIRECQKGISEINLSYGHIWYLCNIGSVAMVVNGSTPSRKENTFWNGDIPWVSSGEVRNNEIDITNEKITEAGFNGSSARLHKSGTVLIAMIGEGKTRGQSAILKIDATINQNIAAINLEHGKVLSKFMWYWLQLQYKNNREKGAGSGPQALNCQRVRELEFLLPSVEEQHKIVFFLDNFFAKEEKAKELCSVLDNIDLIKKSILARAFRGELGTNDPAEERAVELLKTIC